MYKPINPCHKCTERNLDVCLACESWKAYKAKMIEYYDAEYGRKSIDRAAMEARDKLLKKKKRQQGYSNFHMK